MKPCKLALFANVLVCFVLVLSPLASPAHAERNATFTVNANSDLVDVLPGDGVCETAAGNGMCTLRAAIMEANVHIGDDIIELPAATYQLTISGADEDLGATGDLDITDSLNIRGQFQGNTIIDADGLADRVFDISGTGVTVNISRVKITNGSVTVNGGAIRARADLTLQDFYLDYSHASGGGGAIYSSKTLTLINGTVYRCSSGLQGGAIYTTSNLNTNGTVISTNTADGEGGAIFANSTAQVHLIDTNLLDNEAFEDGRTINSAGELEMEGGYINGGEAGGNGGGMYIAENGTATLTDVSFMNNHAASGGGVWIGPGADFKGFYSLFDMNSTDVSGGALRNENGSLTLTYSTLSNNNADSGGAILTNLGINFITASTLISNTATTYGGGIHNNGNVTLKGVTLSANRAQNGGGVFNTLDLKVENSTISKNHSVEDGGGIYDRGLNTYIYNYTITGNLAGSTMELPSGVGGGIYVFNSTLFFRNTILSSNHHRQLLNLIADDCHGTLTSGDYNPIGTLDNCTLWGELDNNLIGSDPLLGELADNGGRTHTHALLEGSPAIDGGNPAGCLGKDDLLLYFDQRGFNRHLDGDKDGSTVCDIGAFELSHNVTMYLPLLVK